MKRFLALLAVVTLAMALQAPQPIPPYPGDGNSQHDGQPNHCQSHTDRYQANCDCKAKSCEHTM